MDGIDELVARAKDGALNDEELEAVARRLEARPPQSYKLLYVLARSGYRPGEDLIASFLESPEDPMLARLALQTLCDQWGLAHKYMERLKDFLQGVEWDIFDEVKQVACSAAGYVLATESKCDLLTLLINIAVGDSSDLTRICAVEALASALGRPSMGIPRGEVDEWQEDVVLSAMFRRDAEYG
uniref:hypothetical protein n=1 Tax=Herbidospora sakaeratensis TaxID=564415 RepID=UPI0012FB17AE|nr:hypothetical protein [Herbidospora sakaeratensis]